MEKESEIQLLESLDQLEVCFSESVSNFGIFVFCVSCQVVACIAYRNERP